MMNNHNSGPASGNYLSGMPHLPLATLPVPVVEHAAFALKHGMASFHIKQDNRTNPSYGGNKIRKLEYLLGYAKSAGFQSVITFGAAGSNHALATAIAARGLGMKAALVLGPQHNSRHVRANLLSALHTRARLYPCDWKDTARAATTAFHRAWEEDGCPPYVIPPGGSSPLGAAGYVNAALELHNQVRQGILPEPDVIYVASGTMGTCTGLALGISAAGMKTRVMAVRVTKAPYTSLERAESLFNAANKLLRGYDPAFPEVPWNPEGFAIRDEFYGDDYALFTEAGMTAVACARAELGVQIEGVYTGKTFAAVLADAAVGNLRNKHVVFWNTYAGDDALYSNEAVTEDWRTLPEPLQQYFAQPVQPLDRD